MKLTKIKPSKIKPETIFKQVQKIFQKHFNKKYVCLDKKLETLNCPAGFLIYEKGLWLFALDYTWHENTNDDEHGIFANLTMNYLVRDLALIIPDIEFTFGYHIVFDNDGNYVDTLYNEEILKKMQETDLFYSAAKTVLEREIIEKSKEKSE